MPLFSLSGKATWLVIVVAACRLGLPQAAAQSDTSESGGADSAAAKPAVGAAKPQVLNLWPERPPGETKDLPPEADRTRPSDRLIAGRRIIKLANVSTPQIAVYRPVDEGNGAAVLICPGGGHHILAWDLEGTEVAEWLNTLGVTAIVVKYRVPFRDPERRWRAAVQDSQRAVSLVRSRAEQWRLDPKRIGICGFSAGGETAALTCLLPERQYEAVDAVDKYWRRPDFAILVYPAYLVDKTTGALRDDIEVGPQSPPTFLVHAFDDGVTARNSLLLADRLKQSGVSTELHMYATGGHGYGLRPTKEAVTRWPKRCSQWLGEQGWLEAPRRPAAE